MTESGDYISREDLLERIDGIWDCNDMVFRPNDHCCNVPEDCKGCKWAETRDAIRRIVENFPAADVRPVVRGEWLPIIEGNEYGETYQTGCYCSECGEVLQHEPYFCPNCGADMREES